MKRETTAYERVMFHYSNKGPMFFAFRMTLRGELDEAELRNALSKVRQEIPLTAVRIYKDSDKKQWITTDDVPEYPLEIRDNFSGNPSEEVIAALKEPFDNEKGPMARFVLLRNGTRNDIIAVFQHAVGDGVGAVVFLERLLVHLGDPDATIISATPENWAPELHRMISRKNLEKIQEMDPPPYKTDKDYTKYTVTPKEPEPYPRPDFELQTAHFSREETARLVSAAKKAGVTVHSYLGAMILSAFAREFGPAEGFERTIQSPVNFRPQLVPEAERMFGLFNGIITAPVDCNKNRAIADIARDIGNAFHQDMESLKPLAGYYNFMSYLLEGVDDPEEFYDNRKKGGMPMNYDFSFSNLGRINMNRENGKLMLEELYGPTFSATKGERVIGALTCNGELFMTLIYDAACFDHKRGRRIWKNIQESLRGIPA